MFKVYLARQLFKLGRAFIAEKEAKLDEEVGKVIEHTTAEHILGEKIKHRLNK